MYIFLIKSLEKNEGISETANADKGVTTTENAGAIKEIKEETSRQIVEQAEYSRHNTTNPQEALEKWKK